MLKKIELHTHTSYSYDCNNSFGQIITRCVKEGVDALAVCDHNEIEGAFRLAQLAPFKVIIGEEIVTKEGEIIGLFLKKFIPPGLSAAETIRRIKQQNGLVYLPHPFDLVTRKTAVGKENIKKILNKVDIVEVFNGRTILPWYNQSALHLAKKFSKPAAVGSDAHTVYEFGRNYLLMPDFDSPATFLRSLRKAKRVTAPVMPWVFLLTKWTRFQKRKISEAKPNVAAGLNKCDLCGGRRFSLIYKKRGIPREKYFITDYSYGVHPQIVKCLDCGLAFVYPQDKEQKLIARYTSFKDWEYEKGREERAKNQEHILKRINQIFPRKGRLLEIGCATGPFLKQAKKDGWKVLGVEPSSWAVKLAQEKYNLPVRQGTLDTIKLKGVSFDVVVGIDVIEHVSSPRRLLSQIKKILRPGGLLCLVTPDRDSLVAQLLGEKWWHVRPDHIYYLSKETLFALLGAFGFPAVKTAYYGWTFSFDYWASRFQGNLPYFYKFLMLLKKLHILNALTKRSYSINFYDSLEIYCRKG